MYRNWRSGYPSSVSAQKYSQLNVNDGKWINIDNTIQGCFVCEVKWSGFVHPGLLHTESDLQRMAQQVKANASPWIDDWNILINNWHAQLSYNPNPQTFVNRGSGCRPDNTMALLNDVAAAYQLALRWAISGNNSYGDRAVYIMNAWADTLTGIGCENGRSHDFILMAGTQGYQFANAAEIMRNYSGWTASAFTKFKNMMLNVFYPINNQFPRPMSEYANWDLGDMASILAIGILCDNVTLFNQAIDYFYQGANNGAIAQMVYYVHPGYLGQGQEAGRDQGHATLDIAHLGVIAEMAWNQGVDLYGFSNNRVLAASEYTAMSNLNNSVTNTYYVPPFAPYMYNHWPTVIYDGAFSTASQPSRRPIWAVIYNHYVNRLGMAAPFTGQMMNLVASTTGDGGGGNNGGNTGGYDQLGFDTLAFTLPSIWPGGPPTGLTGYYTQGNVVLSWWGGAYADYYLVQRGPVGGSLVTIANITQPPFTYTDVGVAAGSYSYRIQQHYNSSSWFSNTITVVADPQKLLLYYKFDETNGTKEYDSSGNNYNGTIYGGATFVSGKIGNALSLNGTSQYVDIPDSVYYNLSDFTIASWLYLNSNTGWQRLFDFGFGTGRYFFFVPNADGGNPSFCISANTWFGMWCANSNSSIPTGQWVHVAITLSGTTVTIYRNGVNIGSSDQIWQQPYQLPQGHTLLGQTWIGRSQYSNDPYLNALVDDFRLYAGALTTSQVSSLYSSDG